MGTGNESILDMYLYETNTLLEQLDGIVLAAETATEFTTDDVNEIFRIMHTIKGSSAMMEFTSLMTVAHRIEDMFFIIRDNSMEAVKEEDRPALFDLMFQAIDFFRSEVELIENNQPTTENIDSFIDEIKSLINKVTGKEEETSQKTTEQIQDEAMAAATGLEAPATAEVPAASEVATSTVVEEAPDTIDNSPDPNRIDWGDGNHNYGLVVFFEEGCGMENLRAFMLTTSLQDFCGNFVWFPENVDQDPEQADYIAEHGFLIRFESEASRTSAIPTVTTPARMV